MQDAADHHREKLRNLNKILQEIASKPTVIDDDEFEHKLKTVQEKIDILTEDAKSGSGGSDRSLVERLNDLHDRLKVVHNLLDSSDQLQATSEREIEKASGNLTHAEETIIEARKELAVSYIKQLFLFLIP